MREIAVDFVYSLKMKRRLHLVHSTIFGLAFDSVKSGIADLMTYLVKFFLL